MKVVADQMAPWLPGRMETLGTDGFGRSDNREYLRRHFEINAESIAAAALSRLARDGQFDAGKAAAAFAELGVDTEKTDPRAGLTNNMHDRPTRRRSPGWSVSAARSPWSKSSPGVWRAIPRRWWRTGWNRRATCSLPALCCSA